MTPTLRGPVDEAYTITYDAAVKRWLPAPPTSVRSDGLAYAYSEIHLNPGLSTHIHIVSLPDGRDRVISVSSDARIVVAYGSDGVYVKGVGYGSDAPDFALWRLNPVSGLATRLPFVSGYGAVVDRGALWISTGGFLFYDLDHLYRVNLSTGSVQTWINTAGWGGFNFIGLDSNGEPLLDVGTNPYASSGRRPSTFATNGLYGFTAPNRATLIGEPPYRPYGPAFNDSHGTWIASERGLFLLTRTRQYELVSGVTEGLVSGPCL